MKLQYKLDPESNLALGLTEGEEVWYCVPLDLKLHPNKMTAVSEFADKQWFVVTTKRLVVLENGRLLSAFDLKDCEKVKCEHQIYSGIVTVFGKDGSKTAAARFSMRQITRVAYVARGAQNIITAMEENRPVEDRDRVISRENEKYCEKCNRALPGTSKCPYCDGKADVLKKFLALCGEFVGKFLMISVMMVLASGIDLLNPMIQKDFVDHTLTTGNGTVKELIIFIAITFTLLVVRLGLGFYRYWCCVKLGASISMSLRKKLYYKIQVLSLSFINNRRPGELMNRVSRDTRQIREFMEEVFGDMFSTLLTMIVALVMMFSISVKMTLLSLVFVLVVVVITRVFWHHIHTIFHRQWLKFDDLNSNLQDILAGMRIVKCFGQEERESKKFTQKTREFAQIQRRNETFWAVFFPILSFLMGAGTYVAVWFGGLDVLQGDMTIGQLLQFITYTGYLFGPLNWMTHMPRMIMQMITSLNRIYDVLDEEPLLADKADCKEFPIQGAFSFKKVSFGYQTYEPVLENVTFDVKPGEMIGLVGASGTGKSTLINLIMRLYDVDQGSITLDGVDLRDIKREALHSQIGVVLQETFLFSGSILANIKFAKPDATLEEVIQAAKAANAHDFICKTPDGYNTYVGEHGYNLSGGERQRIAIARAILNNPRILILDEATSALDTESEFLIQQALDRLIQGRTTFAIAHRLSTLRGADRLVVIDKHGIAEIGTHNELLEQKGIYYGLVNAQLKMSADSGSAQ